MRHSQRGERRDCRLRLQADDLLILNEQLLIHFTLPEEIPHLETEGSLETIAGQETANWTAIRELGSSFFFKIRVKPRKERRKKTTTMFTLLFVILYHLSLVMFNTYITFRLF